MNNNDGSGCVMSLLLAIVLVGIVFVAIGANGLPQWDGLTWDTTTRAEYEATERLRIEQEQATERLRIVEKEATVRVGLIALAIVGALCVAGASIYAIAYKMAQRPVVIVQPAARLTSANPTMISSQPRRKMLNG